MTHTSTDQPEALRLALVIATPKRPATDLRNRVAAELRRLHARVQELDAEKERLIEAYVPCPSATEAYMYGITQEKPHGE